MSDEFDFRDEKEKKGVEASLDDFFQPTEEEIGAGKELPIDKDRIEEIKPEPEVKLIEEEEKPTKKEKRKKEKKKKEKKPKEKKAKEKVPKPRGEKSPLLKYLIIALVVILVLGGGYFAYTKFFARPKPAQVVKKPPKPTPVKPGTTPIKPAPGKPEPQPSPTKPAPAKPQPKPTPVQKPAPTKPISTASGTIFGLPSSAPGKGWSCQVGAYMLKESMEEPIKKLRRAGFNNLYYVDTLRNLKIYHLYLQGKYDLNTAQSKKSQLEKLGFKPRLENKAGKYKILIYSYGSGSVAQKAKSKVERAGIGKGEIIARMEKVTLHQLRVGTYSSKAQAIKVKSKLQNQRFHPIIIEEK